MSMFRNLFMRKYVPGFVGGWKAYGRSNDEDAEKRKYLYDYSGNGRDIELFNFAFSGMSGYGGYVYDEGNIIVVSLNTDFVTVKDNKIAISNMTRSGTCCYATSIFGMAGQSLTVNVPAYRIKVSGLKEGERIDIGRGFNDGESVTWVDRVIPSIYGDGVYDIPAWDFTAAPASETAVPFVSDFRPAVYPKDSTPMNVTIEILPLYPGALVSDGVDDYGQCIKGFVLPDDYTVVAIRKTFNTGSDSALASKSRTAGQGAFIFDINGGGYSYGNISSGAYNAPLFSYQTKTSYNGVVISPGSGMDTEDDTLCLFKKGVNRGDYLPANLYDLRIYDHSLTAEELQTVKYEMMSDFEASAMQDVTYVADWDAKGRSNDEEEPARSKWVDKVNGRILNLNNFAFAAESGWNGYTYDFRDWSGNYTYTEQTSTKIMVSHRNEGSSAKVFTELYIKRDDGLGTYSYPGFHVLVTNPNNISLRHDYYAKRGQIAESVLDLHEGINYIPPFEIEITQEDTIKNIVTRFLINDAEYKGDYQNLDFTIEILPLYPGALVNDGVDDTGTADAALGKVGTVLMHWKNEGLPPKTYIYNTGGDDSGRLYMWNASESTTDIRAGIPDTPIEDSEPIMVFRRSGLVSESPLILPYNNNCPIYRLIFIEEQLNDSQVAFLKWKVSKEYNDWCKANGYEYAVEEIVK